MNSPAIALLHWAAWPQAHAHPSWFDWLDAQAGLPLSRRWGAAAGSEEAAVAHALLHHAGGTATAPAPHAWPSWLLQPAAGLQRQVSTAAALNLLPELRLAITASAGRQWDTVLGAGVRRSALQLCRTDLPAQPPPQAAQVRRIALRAAHDGAGWALLGLQLALAALPPQATGAAARVRLAWPCALRDSAPLDADDATRAWLQACLTAAGCLLGGPALQEAA